MAILEFRKVTQDVENCSFDCGIDSINKYVKESYYPAITQHAYAYIILYKERVMGYYQFLFREVELEDLPDEVSDYNPNVKDFGVSAVHLRFIAIDKKYQGRNIGTEVLKIIIKNILDLADQWPIRVFTIDAERNLVDWYESLGFKHMLRNTPGQDGTTVAMYFDCMKYAYELESYVEAHV